MSKKILITGGTGFIGSHLSELLVKTGYSVTVFDRYNIDNTYGWLEHSEYKSSIEFILGDIRDFDSVFKATQNHDVIFHLAALIGIPYSYISPMAYIQTNIVGTYNILEASKLLNIPQTLITSTSETYGTAQYVPIDEEHPLVGQSPYSASKIAADQMAISYFKSFEMPIKIVRPFNTYGPRQSQRAVIPTIIAQLLSGKKEISLGNLSPTRDLTYVEDTCNGFYEIFLSDKLFGMSTNIGMSNEISIGDLFERINTIMCTNASIKNEKNRTRPEASEVERLYCDNTKIMKYTNWQPKFEIDAGLKKTIEWMDKNRSLLKLSDSYVV